MKSILVLMGLPGSGKTALADTIKVTCGYPCRIISSEDYDEKDMYNAFDQAIKEEIDWIVIDDLNLLSAQRQYYIDSARVANYKSDIIITSKFDDEDAYARYAKRNIRGLNQKNIAELAKTVEMPEKN